MHNRRTIALQAPAKLNLALSVGPADPQLHGMHPISSWMTTVDLFDDLTVTRLEPGSLSRYAILWQADALRRSDIDWSITKDLAVRAHQAIERHVGQPGGLPVQLKVEKRIPVGGGLGGGSTNAASMLRAVNDLFALGLTAAELASIGASLGSDVPFLIHGGSAIVEGLGERLTHHAPNDAPRLHATLVFPDAQCATASVYRAFDELGGALLRPEAVRAVAAQRPAPAPDAPFNDLATAAMRIAPALRQHLADIARLAERPAHITGSGSTIFVVCDDSAHAHALAQSIASRLKLPATAVQSLEPLPA